VCVYIYIVYVTYRIRR